MSPILISPPDQLPKYNQDPLCPDLNKPLSDPKVVTNEVIPLPAVGVKKKVPIVVILEEEETQLNTPTVNKP